MHFLYNLTGEIMSKKDYYIVEKNVDKILKGKCTNFLDPHTLKKVTNKLKGCGYQIYYPYVDSDKAIIYKDRKPNIRFSTEMFGDIVIYKDHYYIIVVDSIYDLINKEFNIVGTHHIKLKEVPLTTLTNYTRQYKKIELIVSSMRIDTVISRLIGSSRDSIKKKFLDNEIILNYEPCHKTNYNLGEGDVFSIRKYGKYRFDGIIKNTKKDNYIIKIYKYIDN